MNELRPVNLYTDVFAFVGGVATMVSCWRWRARIGRNVEEWMFWEARGGDAEAVRAAEAELTEGGWERVA